MTRSRWSQIGNGPDSKSGRVGEAIVAVLALGIGTGIAWVDTRPTWDDTGVTAGSLLLAAGFAAAAGLRFWGAAILVASPILLAERSSAGPGVLVSLAFTVAGSLVGVALRRVGRRARVG